MYKRTMLPLVVALCAAIACGGALADGQAKAQVCVACHGADGNSSNPVWPKLAGQNAPYIVSQLKAFETGARDNPSMPPSIIPDAESDLEEIAAFFAAQSLQVPAASADDLAQGQQLYRGGDAERGIPACMACHGPGGAGNGPARYPSLRGQHPEYTIAQLKAYRAGTRTTDAQAMMRSIAARLTDADIEQLARYVSALH
jgi:cytochrome c553